MGTVFDFYGSTNYLAPKIWWCIFAGQGLGYRMRQKNREKKCHAPPTFSIWNVGCPVSTRFWDPTKFLMMPSCSMGLNLVRYKFSSKSIKGLVCFELFEKITFFKISIFWMPVPEPLLHRFRFLFGSVGFRSSPTTMQNLIEIGEIMSGLLLISYGMVEK